MAFDKTGFTQWLVSRGLRAAPTVYPKQLENIEDLGKISINQFIPQNKDGLLALLDHPGTDKFRNKTKSDLTNWQCCVRSYAEYIRQRSTGK